MNNNNKETMKKIGIGVGSAAILIGAFFLQKVIPKLPFEPVSFYCKRVTEVPFIINTDEYDNCIRKNTEPSEEIMRYVKREYGTELNTKQQLCVGDVIERNLSGKNLEKFLGGTPAVELVGYDKSVDMTAEILKCVGKK